jgi:toxin HigB-1
MEIRFQDAEYERMESGLPCIGRWSVAILKAYRKRINFIRQAQDERDLRAWKSLRLEKLGGDRKEEYSIRLNDQWRLILQFEEGNLHNTVIIIGIEDYH